MLVDSKKHLPTKRFASSISKSIHLFTPLLLFVWLLLSGCASHVSRMTPVKAQLRQGHPGKALEELDRYFGEKEGDLVYLMEKGLLLRYAGGLEESNAVFEEAEQLAEDLYTKSISKNLASLITSDKVLPYEGEDFERVIINYFRAMNYLDLGLPEDALVECRKVEAKLQFYEQKYDGDKKYKTDPFIHYLTGLIHESNGEINDAYISYKKAEGAFSGLSDFLGVRRPKYLGGDLLRTASALGFSNEMEEIRREYPHSARRNRIPDGKGEVVLLVEAGFVPMKTEVSLNLPILEDEKDDEVEDLAYRMRGRARIDRDWDHVHYWLKVALPGYQPPMPSPWTGVDVEGESGSLVENFDTLARVSLEDRMPTVLLRALVRALAKYIATTKGEDAIADKHGDAAGAVFGALFNIAAVASEKADLRAWLGLPREIYLVRLVLPAGRHREIEINLLGRGGGSVAKGSVNVEVRPGRITFVAHRFFL